MESKRNDINELSKQKETHRLREWTYGCQGEGIVREFGMDMYTAPKNWCFWTVMLERTLESPLDCKEIQPIHSEGDQPWDFFGRNYAKAETPVLWPPHAKSWLIGKDSDAGRDWGQEKGMTEDEMAGWHHRLNGRESEWTPGVGDEQGGLACYNSWGHKESDTTEWLNWTEMSAIVRWFAYSLALPFFGVGIKTDLFQSCGHCWIFQICWDIEWSNFTASSFRIWNSSPGFYHLQ